VAARTAVVAGTASAVSGRVAARQQQAAVQQAPAPAAAEPAPADATSPALDDQALSNLERLGSLHAKGMLSDAEFTAAKQRVLTP
jgi:hypothetical protein